jgi:hypothetical protein
VPPLGLFLSPSTPSLRKRPIHSITRLRAIPVTSAISSRLWCPLNANLTAINLAFGSPACSSPASSAFTSFLLTISVTRPKFAFRAFDHDAVGVGMQNPWIASTRQKNPRGCASRADAALGLRHGGADKF